MNNQPCRRYAVQSCTNLFDEPRSQRIKALFGLHDVEIGLWRYSSSNEYSIKQRTVLRGHRCVHRHAPRAQRR